MVVPDDMFDSAMNEERCERRMSRRSRKRTVHSLVLTVRERLSIPTQVALPVLAIVAHDCLQLSFIDADKYME